MASVSCDPSEHLHAPAVVSSELNDCIATVDELVCIIGLFRHADRTCKQKVSMKFSGEPPSGFPLCEDIRSSAIHVALAAVVESLPRSNHKSDGSIVKNGVRILRMGQEELKVKIERMSITGWILKLKWGGNLTVLGKTQAEEFGRHFAITQNLSSSCDDFKIYSSTDARCIETASAFARGLVGSSTVPEIRYEDGPDGLGSLDDSGFRHSPLVDRMRTELSAILMSGRRIDETFTKTLFPEAHASSAKSALNEIAQTYRSFADAVLDLCEFVDEFVLELEKLDSPEMSLVYVRWQNIWKTIHRGDSSCLRTVSGALFTSVQISLIGEVFDNAKFDLKHRSLAGRKECYSILCKINALVILLARIVTRSEYGISSKEKAFIGATFLRPLIRKIQFDVRLALGIPMLREDISHLTNHGRDQEGGAMGRFYVGHHSHIVSFVNILRANDLVKDKAWLHQIGNLGYLSQVVISIFRNGTSWRFTVRVGVGDGIHAGDESKVVLDETTSNLEVIDSFFTEFL